MKVVSTGSFEYEIDDCADLQSIHSEFKFAFDALADKMLRLFTRSKKDDFAYRQDLAAFDANQADSLLEAVSVLNDDRQAIVCHIVRELMDQAFAIGAARAIEGLDPIVEESRKAKMRSARICRGKSFPPEKEAAIRKAIIEHGPKVGKIRTALYKQGHVVSDDAIRKRKVTLPMQERLKNAAAE